MTTTRPKELIYFHFLPFNAQEGFHYMFFAFDDNSEYVFDLGGAKDLNDETILSKIKKLMKHKNFKSSPKKPFTLMSSCGLGIESRIKAIIIPQKGKLVMDQATVIEKTHSYASFMSKKFNERHEM